MDREELRSLVSVPEALELLEIEGPAKVPGHIPCLWHDENTASMMIYEDHWHAYCHGIGGDVVNLVMRVLGCTYPKACLFLTGFAEEVDRGVPRVQRVEKISVDFSEQFAQEAQETSLRMREDVGFLVDTKWPHLDVDNLQRWGVRASAYNLLVPHLDAEGVVRGVKTRSLLPAKLGTKNAFTGSCFTTRLYRVLERPTAASAWLVEGESDCWTLSQHFLDDETQTVYAMPAGASTWKTEWADELRQHHVIVLFDNDAAGASARRRVQESLMLASTYVLPDDYNDVAEAYADGWRPVKRV